MIFETETSRMGGGSYRRRLPGRRAHAQAALGTTDSLRSLAWTRSLETESRRSAGSAAKQSSQTRRPLSSRCIVSPASGVRLQPEQLAAVADRAPMKLRTRRESMSGIQGAFAQTVRCPPNGARKARSLRVFGLELGTRSLPSPQPPPPEE